MPTNGQRAYVYDAMTRGLALAVSPSGKKVFVLYRKVARRPERITIGAYPDLSIEQARDRAAEFNGAIARGENPGGARRIVRDEMTLGELFATWLEHHGKPHKKTWKWDQGVFEKHLGAWKLRKISELRNIDVVTLHARIGAKSGPYVANRLVEILSGLFNKAIEMGMEGTKSCTKDRAFRERNRERFLQPQEIPNFFRSLGRRTKRNGPRLRARQSLHWRTASKRPSDEMGRNRFPAATWTIPETKSGEPVTLALPPAAMSILETRKTLLRANGFSLAKVRPSI